MNLIIESIEYFLPKNIVTNIDLHNENPEWDLEKIAEKTGVYKRHIASKNETAYDLSVKACEKLFNYYDKNNIDGIIYCTQSPDYIMPPNSFLLHKDFGLKDEVFAYDFNHACTGYIYCLAMANAFIKSGMAKEILIINTDTYSKYINSKDKSTRVLFGDGASATVVKSSNNRKGLIDIELGSSGKGYDKFWIPAGGLRLPKSNSTSKEVEDKIGNIRTQNNITMDGLGVWSFINSIAPKQVKKLLAKNGLEKKDIDKFIFHQASKMTLDSVINSMGLIEDQVFINIKNIGNTVSASIPIAIKDAQNQGELNTDSLVILSGFGVGLSYGTALLKL